MDCYFCGTELDNLDGFCIECEETANDLGMDYNELKESF